MFERLGLVEFFGVLLPGAFLFFSACFQMVAFSTAFNIFDLSYLIRFIETNTLISSVLFFMMSYLIGVILLLPGADKIDRLSTLYFYFIRRAKVNRYNFWMYELFPYQRSLFEAYKNHDLNHVANFFRQYDQKRARTGKHLFFNYCKFALQGNNSEMAQIATKAEALVRFLSGIAIALGASLTLWLLLAVVVVAKAITLASLCLGVALLNLFLLWAILERFKAQRRQEVLLVMNGIYLVLTGGASNAGNKLPECLQRSVLGIPSASVQTVRSELG